jgi:dephospho-CoA kinase
MPNVSKTIVGITGNIASGKSEVSKYLKSLGFVVIDTDVITSLIYLHDDDFKEKMIKLFGKKILRADDSIDKRKVAKIVFDDPDEMKKLSKLIHPLIKKELKKVLEPLDGYIFVEAPVLFEAGFEDMFDQILMISVSYQEQLKRLMKRPNMSQQEALKIIEAQMPQSLKEKKSDYVIDNSYDLTTLHRNIDQYIKKLTA